MHIHIVNSVKGGAGKSTVVCKLAISLMCGINRMTRESGQGLERHSVSKNQKRVCIIDVDLLGTSWEYTFGRSIVNASPHGQYFAIYLNDLIADYSHYEPFDFIRKIRVLVDNVTEVELDVIMCNPLQSAKNRFKVPGKSAMPDIQLDRFSECITKLIKKMEKDRYDHIIFDMPPNSDPYSDKIFNQFLDHHSPYPVALYMVSTYDVAHIQSTMEWYGSLQSEHDSLRVVTKNDSLPATKRDDGGSANLSAKIQWLKNTKYKFFIVFNNNYGLDRINGSDMSHKLSVLESTTLQKLLPEYPYYFMDYDSLYSSSKSELMFSTYRRDIAINNTMDFENFYLFHELKWTRKQEYEV